MGLWLFALASSDIGLGHFDDAIDECHRAIGAGLRTFPAYAILATAYAMTNRIGEAKAAVVEALKLNPKLTVKNITERYCKTPAVAEGLRKAGTPRRNEASLKRSLRERVRCSSLVDWPVYVDALVDAMVAQVDQSRADEAKARGGDRRQRLTFAHTQCVRSRVLSKPAMLSDRTVSGGSGDIPLSREGYRQPYGGRRRLSRPPRSHAPPSLSLPVSNAPSTRLNGACWLAKPGSGTWMKSEGLTD